MSNAPTYGTDFPGQDTLPLDIVQVPSRSTATIQERFEAFHALNPWILDAYEALAAEGIRAGRQKMGIGALTEILRWDYSRRTQGDAFKISHDYRSRYVDLMIERHPEWDAYFDRRPRRTP